jgi:hypothetical protein
MTISTTDFGYIVSNSVTHQNMYLPLPLVEAPGYWCDSDYPVRHKLRARLHIDSALGADVIQFKGRFDDDDTTNQIYITANNISDAWTTTWANAVNQNDYPLGLPLPNMMSEDKAPRYTTGRMKFLKVAADVEVNGIEIGGVHDNAYADLDVELLPRSGASRQWLAKDGLNSWLISHGIIESLNRLVYSGEDDKAAWRIVVPMLGGR